MYPYTAGSLTLQLKRFPDAEAPKDMVQEDSLRDPDIANCALNAVNDIARAMLPYEPVPQGTKLVFHFANK